MAAAGALAFRLPSLDLRPMHGDEANQAVKTGILLETGEYEYDPHDHHGPTLYYFALISAWVRGEATFEATTIETYRIVPVLFGAALILLLWFLRDGVGYGPVLFAGVLFAVSPGFVYYSRYFIQEMMFVAFTMGAIGFGWRYIKNPSWGWALATGISLGLMHATKETCIISFAGMTVGLAAAVIWERLEGTAVTWEERLDWKRLSVVVVSGLVVSVVLFSAFFTHWRGPLDSILTYGNYFTRAGGAEIHDKPWYYYLSLLGYTSRGPGAWFSEGFVLLMGLAGAGFIIFGRQKLPGHTGFLRFLLVYTLFLVVFYSAIPYKTPWSMLSMYAGIVLLAGVGAAGLYVATPHFLLRGALSLVAAAGLWHLGAQAYRASFDIPADPRNPYVYAHTSSAFLRLPERMENLAAVHSEGNEMRIYVIQPDRDYWPLPWYLRRFENVGYFHEIPANLDAPVIIASPRLRDELAERLGDDYFTEMHGLRPSVLRLVYIKRDLWDSFIESRS